MFKRLKSLLGGAPSLAQMPEPSIETAVFPDTAFYAVGDIHGCLEQMDRLIAQIETQDAEATIVFLGDYIDRGVKSAQVLKRLYELQTSQPERIICIMGNHERMMLEFIDDPLGRGARWLANGGVQTLQSFGLKVSQARLDAETAMDIADQFEAVLPEGMQQWVRDLPLHWSSGNMHCVHAAMDPATPVSDQKERHLLWGHRDFMTVPRDDGNCVIYGHVIVPRPDARDGRFAIDTGAYKTGKLTAVHVTTDGWSFLQS